ncbi:MAG: sigma 54-interacting transcriptional regulator [Candidatus Eisenbacteria bacterium]
MSLGLTRSFEAKTPALPPRAVRRRWRERAYFLATQGRWRDALELQRALVLSSQRRGSPREELADRFRLLRWQLALGRWNDALEEIDRVYARLARRGASGGAAAGWIFLGRAVAYFQLGWGARFRRTLALVLRNARRAQTAGLLPAALEVLACYEAERRPRRELPAWLARFVTRCAAAGGERPSFAAEIQCALEAPELALPEPHHPAKLGWSRLPELIGSRRGRRGDALLRIRREMDGVRTAETTAAISPWLERAESDPSVTLPPALAVELAQHLLDGAPEVDPAARRRWHHALSQLAMRQGEILPRAALLEALSEVSLWVAADLSEQERARSAALLSRSRADLGLAAGLLRRLGLEARADRLEQRWARLTWPGASLPAGVSDSERGIAGRASEVGLRQALRDIGFITVDPRTLSGLSSLRMLAGSSLPVLVLGESGTGKEVIARAIHRWSALRGEVVPIHCGAIPRELLESELFGHTRGAFTGAAMDKPGLVEAADGGTLFLDEIGEMGAEAQMKLLRVLESGEVRRVGDLKPRIARVRLVAATHRDLARAVDEGFFRLDLFHRIRGVVVELRPLRERRVDIPELAHHFLKTFTAPEGPLRLSDRCLARLLAHPWPGNVRELRATLLRAAHLAQSLGLREIPVELLGLDRELDLCALLPEGASEVRGEREGANGVGRGDDLAFEGTIDLERVLDDLERRLILRALERHSWNRTRAAESLGGLSRTTLIGKMRRLGIEPRDLGGAGAIELANA